MRRSKAAVCVLSAALCGCFGGADLTIRIPLFADGGLNSPATTCGGGCLAPPPNVCEGSSMVRTYGRGTCTMNGCTYNSSVTQCPLGCTRGACIGDPCMGVSCTTPPQPTCVDGGVLQITSGVGLCTGGSCEYLQVTTVECPDAGICVNGACATNPCIGVDCSHPPAQYCADVDTITTFSGTCRSGACDWVQADSFCPFGCVDDKCAPDPCLGVTCNMPPSPVCVGTTIRRSWDQAGTCVGGTCRYTPRSMSCAGGCLSGACTVDGGADAGVDTDAGVGIDAGAADAGRVDAGRTDAGDGG